MFKKVKKVFFKYIQKVWDFYVRFPQNTLK